MADKQKRRQPRKQSAPMTDDELDAFLASLGFRVVCRIAPDTDTFTPEQARALIGGDITALRDIFKLSRKDKPDEP